MAFSGFSLIVSSPEFSSVPFGFVGWITACPRYLRLHDTEIDHSAPGIRVKLLDLRGPGYTSGDG